MDAAVSAALRAGADVLVAPVPGPIGRDGRHLVAWRCQHPALLAYEDARLFAARHSPDIRVYVSPESIEAFVASYLAFSGGRVVSDRSDAAGTEIGRPDQTFRRIRLESEFGRTVVWATDGHLPYPYGRETTGYEVADLDATLDRARSAGVEILVEPVRSERRASAMVEFPGGYIAEIHAPTQ